MFGGRDSLTRLWSNVNFCFCGGSVKPFAGEIMDIKEIEQLSSLPEVKMNNQLQAVLDLIIGHTEVIELHTKMLEVLYEKIKTIDNVQLNTECAECMDGE